MQTYGVCFCGVYLGMRCEPTFLPLSKTNSCVFFFFFNVPMDHWINFRIQSLTVSKHSQLIFNVWWFSKSTLESSLSLNIVVITFQDFLLTPETENCLHLVNKGETKKRARQRLALGKAETNMFAFPLINSCSNTHDGSLTTADFGLNDVRNKHRGKLQLT